MTGDNFALTAGWGHFGLGQAVMPGQGRAVERSYTAEERRALGNAASVLGESTFDMGIISQSYSASATALTRNERAATKSAHLAQSGRAPKPMYTGSRAPPRPRLPVTA